MLKPLHTKNLVGMKTRNYYLRNESVTIRSIIVMCLFLSVGVLKANIQAFGITGDTSVCQEAVETYSIVSPVGGNTYTWSVLGGSFVGGVNTGTSVDVEWGTMGGTFTITAVDNSGDVCFIDVEVEEDLSLACNDYVQITMDENCEAQLVADMLLEGELYPNDSYTVTAYNKNGTIIPGALLTKDHVGMTLDYRVTHICSGVTCWGRMIIEDKLIPDLLCQDTSYDAMCGMSLEPEDIGLPLPVTAGYTRVLGENKFLVWDFDPCDTVCLTWYDEVEKNGCEDEYYKEVIRYWKAVDASGNMTQCVDTIHVARGSIAGVVFPPNYDGIQKFDLQCDHKSIVTYDPLSGVNIGWNMLENGLPSPYPAPKGGGDTLIGTGYPTGVECDHIAVTHRDRTIETCSGNGSTYKLFRTWRVYDWCTGEVVEHLQLIKVVDTNPPQVVCPQNDTVGMEYWKCSASIIIEPPQFLVKGVNDHRTDIPLIIRECSEYYYDIKHKPATSPDDCTPVPGLGTKDNVRLLPNGMFEVFDMPAGCNWIYYEVIDSCGNSTMCRYDIYVKDDRQPVAVCDEHTVVSLNDAGEAELCGFNVDNGSADNCSPHDSLTFLLKKMGSSAPFTECISFTCADVARSPIMVIFRVYDQWDNYGECMVEVEIQDKIAPTLVCPPHIEIDCSQDYRDTSVTGSPTATDQCGAPLVTWEDIDSSLDDCGVGYVIRRWRAEDAGGRFHICDQRIDIENRFPFTKNRISFPGNYTTNGCEILDAHPDNLPAPFDRPTWTPSGCSKVVAGFEDDVYYDIPGYCIKIIRTWTVIDWCQYDVNNPSTSPGVFSMPQTIYVRNNADPVFANDLCNSKEYCADDDCETQIDLIGQATDDCTDQDDLVWKLEIDIDNNGSVDITLPHNNATRDYPVGQHKLTWYVKDACGNEVSCMTILNVKDCKEPSPVCKPGIVTTIMPSAGYVDIWASDFDDKSFDNCYDNDELVFSFSSDTTDKFRRVTCDDLENGIVDTFSYEMWVTDPDGNQDFCLVTIIVQDNQNVCPDVGNGNFVAVGGAIKTHDDKPVEQVKVDLMRQSLFEKDMMTPESGEFAFHDLDIMEDYSMIPFKDDDHMSGVSTADLVHIQRHLLGKSELTSAYKLIAADVNNNQDVSAADISALRKLILGKTTGFTNNTSWRFIDARQQFTDQTDPWADPWNEYITHSELDHDEMSSDFVAVKVGDVDNSFEPGAQGGSTTRSGQAITLMTDNQSFVKGQKVVVPIRATSQQTIIGMQFTLNFGQQLSFLGISGDKLHVTNGNIGVFADDHVLSFSWNDDESIVIDETGVLFNVVFQALEEGTIANQFSINSAITTAEAYDELMNVSSVELNISGKESSDKDHLVLYQNIPNPFENSTKIGFDLPEEAEAVLTVFDVTGKVILTAHIEGRKGYNSFDLKVENIRTTGVMYYQLESNQQVATKRMLLIN